MVGVVGPSRMELVLRWKGPQRAPTLFTGSCHPGGSPQTEPRAERGSCRLCVWGGVGWCTLSWQLELTEAPHNPLTGSRGSGPRTAACSSEQNEECLLGSRGSCLQSALRTAPELFCQETGACSACSQRTPRVPL